MRRDSVVSSIALFVLVLIDSVHSQPRLDDATNSNLDGSTITITPSSSYKVYCYTPGSTKNWYKINGGTGTSILNISQSGHDTNIYASNDETGSLALHFESFRTNDIGEYECRYTTAATQLVTTLSIYLTIPPTPTPAPTPMPLSQVQDVNVTRTVQDSSPALRVSWSAVSGSCITYAVCYSTTSGTESDPPSGVNCGASGITGTSTTLGPLSIGTTYYIWVAAVSSGRRGPYSDRRQETTYQVPSRVNPPNLTKTASSGRPALRVTWTAPSSDRPITKYQVQYRISGSANWSTIDVTSTFATLKNLSASTSYQVQVRAVSDIGAGTGSEIRTITTYRVPSRVNPPSLTKTVSSGKTAVRVTWTAPSSDRPITTYQVRYRMSGASWNTKDVTLTSFILENLPAGTNYQVEVRAISDVGASPFSEISTITTYRVPSQVAPPVPVKAVSSGRPALNVTWTAPSSDRPITKYQVQYRPNGTNTSSTKNVTSTSTTLENLSAGTSYQVQVRAVSDIGNGPYSPIRTNTTYEVPSQVGPPVLTKAARSGRPALRVAWTALAGEHPKIRYQVQYRINGSASWSTIDVTSTSTTLENLTAGTSYEVQVRAVSDIGAGSYSETREITTYRPVPDLAPEGLSCVETKSNSALLQWSIPLQSGRNGVIFQYVVKLYAVTSQDGGFQTIKNFTVALDNPTFDSPSTITYNVTDLSSNTVYRWRVAAINSAGVGLFTTTAGFTTLEEVSDIHTNGLDADSDASSDGLSAGLFIAGLFSGVIALLLVGGIIWGVCKISKMSQNKNIEGEYTEPTNIQMTECPAYESIDREGNRAERLYEDIESRYTKGN